MMFLLNSFLFLSLIFLHFVAGASVIRRFGISMNPVQQFSAGILIGMGIHAFLPFLLELCFIPINRFTLFGLLFIATFFIYFQSGLSIKQSFRFGFKIRSFPLYLIPLLIPIFVLMVISIWRAYYFPPFASDVTSGAEAIADIAIKEKHLINSVFDLYQTGNSLKPPYLSSLQLMYKLSGFAFGQIWLSPAVICFLILLGTEMKRFLHASLMLVLLFLFLAIPEMYAYTFSVMYDYPNMIYFTVSLIFLEKYLFGQKRKYLFISSLCMGIATYIRPETLVLGFLIISAGLLLFFKATVLNKLKAMLGFMAIPFLVYFLSVYVYIHVYLPVNYDISDQLNGNLFHLTDLGHKYKQAITDLLFGSYGLANYSYFPYLFVVLAGLELLIFRSFNKRSGYYLTTIGIVFLFFPLLSHLLPGVTIDYTVKRAYFKLFPLMMLYFSGNHCFKWLSEKMR